MPCQGISDLSKVDFEYAKMMRSTIKLLGTAMVSTNGDKLSVFVSPVLVPLNHPIASARGAGNIVAVNSKVQCGAGLCWAALCAVLYSTGVCGGLFAFAFSFPSPSLFFFRCRGCFNFSTRHLRRRWVDRPADQAFASPLFLLG